VGNDWRKGHCLPNSPVMSRKERESASCLALGCQAAAKAKPAREVGGVRGGGEGGKGAVSALRRVGNYVLA